MRSKRDGKRGEGYAGTRASVRCGISRDLPCAAALPREPACSCEVSRVAEAAICLIVEVISTLGTVVPPRSVHRDETSEKSTYDP